MRLIILFLFLFPGIANAQFTFTKALDLTRTVGMGYENNEAEVLDKLKALYSQGYMLESYDMVHKSGARSDTFALADLNGDAINEHISLGFGSTTFQNRAVPLIVVTATTDNLNQYLKWMADIEQSGEFEKKTYEPLMSTYLSDDRRQQTGIIVNVPYTLVVNNPTTRVKKKVIPNVYTLVVSRMIKPITK